MSTTLNTRLPRVTWTENEKALIVNTLVAYLKSNGKNHEAVTQPGWFAFYTGQAQQFIAEERRRRLTTPNHCPWLVTGVAAAFGIVAPKNDPNSLAQFVDSNLDAVIAHLSKTHVVAPRTEMVTRQVVKLPHVKKRMIRVLIVGVLPNQSAELSAEFGHLLDLRFWHSSDGNRADLVEADYCLLLTSFTTHSIQNQLKVHFKARFQPTFGGVASLKRIIRELMSYGVYRYDHPHQTTVIDG